MRIYHLCILLFISFKIFAGAPEGIYLTWRDDPRTTMLINWITLHTDDDDDIEYKESTCTSCSFRKLRGTHKRLNVNNIYQVHRVNMEGLQPNTSYTFRLETDPAEEYTFLTMSDDLKDAKKFIIGGDVYGQDFGSNSDRYYTEMNQLAASYDPFCVFFGGDLSYAGNAPEDFKYWLRWFKIWWKTMHKNGRLIPMVTALGNHEVEQADRNAINKLLYFDFFPPVNNVGYFKLRFGTSMTMLVLDSNNISSIEGSQRNWLDTQLKQDTTRDHVFALYHHPAYPSVRSFTGTEATKIRTFWSPLFERYGLDTAFEHHEHSYKRTYPLRAGKRDAKGILYVGDGAWSVKPREINPKNKDYLAVAKSERNFILMELQGKERTFKAISHENKIIDEWQSTAP